MIGDEKSKIARRMRDTMGNVFVSWVVAATPLLRIYRKHSTKRYRKDLKAKAHLHAVVS